MVVSGIWQTSVFMAGRGAVLDIAFVGSRPTDHTKFEKSYMNPFKKLIRWIQEIRKRRALKKRIEELRKRDPFIY